MEPCRSLPWVVMAIMDDIMALPLRWSGDSVSNHQPHHCLLNRLFRRRSKKTSKLSVTGTGTGEFPAHMASNAENVSIWWRHHDYDFRKCDGSHWTCGYHVVCPVKFRATLRQLHRVVTIKNVRCKSQIWLLLLSYLCNNDKVHD